MSSQYLNDDLSALDYVQKDYLRGLQLERLRKMVQHAYDHVELFNSRMKERNLVPADVKSLGDIAKLPFMVKADLRDTYPFGLFAVPMSEVVRLHASSGTTGKPIVVGYTRSDLEVWMEVVKRAFASCGLTRDDVIQVSYGYGLFTGGLGAHYGAEALGATVVPTSGGNTQRQIMLMRDFGTTAVCCTPSYFNFMIEQALAQGIDMRDLPIKAGIFGAEPWTEEMRKRIEAASGIKAYDIYGLSEIIGPGVAIECGCQQGMHVFEDHFYPEIINPETGEVLPDGETGELVLTTLSKYAMPMIRYRTRDITKIIAEPCECGRTIRRIARISSRSDDMFIIRGVNVFPSQIETAILSVDGTMPHYNIILYTENGLDNIEVDVEINEELFSDKVRSMEALQHRLTSAIEGLIGLRVRVKLVAPNTIQRSEGKARRVIDHRER
ncbi:phenylacetate--CoA ligase family protein [Victivallis vadensis]|uniref:Phenylacetate-coenzyme A ligase n=1 Tax=Victivallis vadensis TaxID=172901 RepID=A0A2U1AUG9_9BACT|nr:phenylacetate--CoA ligase [Victivallis vadensis]PVY40040.1 phenylacetate-CoA ligase [Victivallis vadensis]PWM89477.1 MAG: phenylacetate--CoA ligase [Lentisphaerota bacterium]HJH06020.1 phenylacetate--CoA ligase [Victivallis vadensis]